MRRTFFLSRWENVKILNDFFVTEQIRFFVTKMRKSRSYKVVGPL